MTTEQGQIYTDEGAEATDAVDDNDTLTSQLGVVSTVDISAFWSGPCADAPGEKCLPQTDLYLLQSDLYLPQTDLYLPRWVTT